MTDTRADAHPRSLASPAARYVRFIVLGDARTGSYMLVQALASHPNITCFSELFQWQLDYVDFNVTGYDNDNAEDRALRDQDFERFLSERIFCQRTAQTHAVGFKLLYAHVWGFNGLLERLVEDTDIRVLHLRRRNLLRILVSAKLAKASGVWRVDRGFTPAQLLQQRTWLRALRRPGRAFSALRRWLRAPPPAAATRRTVTLSVEECQAFFLKGQHEVDHFTKLFAQHPTLSMLYEDLLSDRSRAFSEAQAFLGVPQARLTVTLARQNPEPLSGLIDNFDEVREAFGDTPFAAFFAE